MLKKEIAIIGASASGKSDLAIKIAKKIDAYILSLDSLSIYKEIDIVSAKPNIEEKAEIKHFGIDEIYPNEDFNVATFFKIYQQAKKEASENDKNLIIVGGSSFYLKTMIDGLSEIKISDLTKEIVKKEMNNLENAYQKLQKIDSEYAKKLYSNDSYRIEKALSIYYESAKTPSIFFNEAKKNAPLSNICIYEIEIDRALLRERITKRTEKMLKLGLIDEVFYLEKKYTRSPNSMGAIGIKETLAYFDGIYSLSELKEKIITNTARLAKRQTTFNKTQFSNVIRGKVSDLMELFS